MPLFITDQLSDCSNVCSAEQVSEQGNDRRRSRVAGEFKRPLQPLEDPGSTPWHLERYAFLSNSTACPWACSLAACVVRCACAVWALCCQCAACPSAALLPAALGKLTCPRHSWGASVMHPWPPLDIQAETDAQHLGQPVHRLLSHCIVNVLHIKLCLCARLQSRPSAAAYPLKYLSGSCAQALRGTAGACPATAAAAPQMRPPHPTMLARPRGPLPALRRTTLISGSQWVGACTPCRHACAASDTLSASGGGLLRCPRALTPQHAVHSAHALIREETWLSCPCLRFAQRQLIAWYAGDGFVFSKRSARRERRTARRSEAIDRAFAQAHREGISDFLPQALMDRSDLFRGSPPPSSNAHA